MKLLVWILKNIVGLNVLRGFVETVQETKTGFERIKYPVIYIKTKNNFKVYRIGRIKRDR